MRRIVLGLVGAGLALGAAAVVTVATRAPFDGSDVAMLDALRAATGLRIEANGGATVSLFPTPRIHIPAVSVAKGDEPPFAVATEVVGAPRLWALLRGRLELGEITLGSAHIALDRTPVDELFESIGRSRAEDRGFTSIRLKDGRLDVADRTVEHVDAGLVWRGPGDPVSFSGYGKLSGRDVEATFALSDPSALARGEPAPFRARLEGGGTRVLFDGAATNAGGVRLTGDLSARASSLRETLRWLHAPAPRQSSPLRGFSLAGRATADRSGFTIANAELDLEGGSFLGAGRLTTVAGRPVVEATLDTDALDLNPYVAGIAPTLKQDGAWNQRPIDLAPIAGYDLDLRLSADAVTIGDLTFGATAATVTIAKGAFDLAVGEANAYGGLVGGRLGVERQGDGARVRIQADASDVSLAGALKRIVERPALTGALTGDLVVEGSGVSVADVVASLRGHGEARVAGGALTGFSKSRTLALAGLRGSMSVETAAATLVVMNGVARTSELSIVGPDAAFALAGEARIAERQLKLEGTVKPTDGSWTLPVRVDGSFASPKVRPNLSAPDPRSADRTRPSEAE